LTALDYNTATTQRPPTELAGDEPVYGGLALSTWLTIGIIALLMAATFWVDLRHLYLKTNPFTGEANWGHSVCIPLIGLYYLYLNRESLLAAKSQPLLVGGFDRARIISATLFIICGGLLALLPALPFMTRVPLLNKIVSISAYVQALGQALAIFGALALLLNWSIGSLLFGLFAFAYGIWPGKNDFVRDLGMVITLFGVVLTLCGWDVMKIAWFPIVFLVCAIPWPGLVYSAVASPLQELAARVAVGVLNIGGVEASQVGTKIFMERGLGLPPRTLNVAEACAGLRSLMTFISVGAAIAFLSSRPMWQKLIITASAIPIAIFCNVMRVAGQGLLDHYVSTELSESFAHQMVGLVMLIPAFFLLLGVAWLLDQIFVEEVDVAARARKADSGIIVARRPAAAQAASREGASA